MCIGPGRARRVRTSWFLHRLWFFDILLSFTAWQDRLRSLVCIRYPVGGGMGGRSASAAGGELSFPEKYKLLLFKDGGGGLEEKKNVRN